MGLIRTKQLISIYLGSKTNWILPPFASPHQLIKLMSHTYPKSKNRPLTAFAIVIGTVFLFALGDILVKHLTMHYPVMLVLAIRYWTSLLFLLALAWPRIGASLWETVRTWSVLGRGLVLALCSLTLGNALQLMPVGETIAILYLFPILVMIISIPFLGERVSPLSWSFAALSFGGILMIVRPGGGLDAAGIAFALLAAILSAFFHLITRELTKTETKISLLFNATLVGAICLSLAALFAWEGSFPNLKDFSLIGLLGVITNIAYFLLTVAYQYAPASLIAPANWMQVVWAALLSWLFFDHFPDQWTILGMLVIIAAGVGIAIKTHRENSNHPTGTPV